MSSMPKLFDSVTADAIRHAESLRGIGDALDTRLIFMALAHVHVRGRWDRIWLKCSHSLEDIARQRLITPGILALGLLLNPRTAAAKALGVGDTIDHKELLELIEDELLGFSNIHDDNYDDRGPV